MLPKRPTSPMVSTSPRVQLTPSLREKRRARDVLRKYATIGCPLLWNASVGNCPVVLSESSVERFHALPSKRAYSRSPSVLSYYGIDGLPVGSSASDIVGPTSLPLLSIVSVA